MKDVATDYLVSGPARWAWPLSTRCWTRIRQAHITNRRPPRPTRRATGTMPIPSSRLHQPSATYGVNSLETVPPTGRYPLAINAGNVSAGPPRRSSRLLRPADERTPAAGAGAWPWHPLTDLCRGRSGVYRIRPILSGDERAITVRRKLVMRPGSRPRCLQPTAPPFAVLSKARGWPSPAICPDCGSSAATCPITTLSSDRQARPRMRYGGLAGSNPGWPLTGSGWVRPREFVAVQPPVPHSPPMRGSKACWKIQLALVS